MPSPCDPLTQRQAELEADLTRLQDDLAHASPQAKGGIVALIQQTNAALRTVRMDLARCEEQNRPPSGTPSPSPVPVSAAHLQIFEHDNFRGRTKTFGIYRPARYARAFNSQIGIPNDSLSSFCLRVTGTWDLFEVYFFEHEGFQGRFHTRSAIGSNAPVCEPFVGAAFNDLTSSILLVRRATNELALNFADVLPADINDRISGMINDRIPEAYRQYLSFQPNLRYTWAPLPSAQQGFAVDLRLRGHFHAEDAILWWDLDTDFEISLKVQLAAGGGRLQARLVSCTPAYVEDSRADQEVRNAIERLCGDASFRQEVQAQLGTLVAGINFPIQSVYLLPGNMSRAVTEGSTATSVTVVLVLADDPPPE